MNKFLTKNIIFLLTFSHGFSEIIEILRLMEINVFQKKR